MLEGVLIDETVKLGFQLAGHFERSSATGAVQEAAGAFASKALHPFAQGGVGEMEEVRDGFYCTFRTLFRTSEAILEEPLLEGRGGAIYRFLHAL